MTMNGIFLYAVEFLFSYFSIRFELKFPREHVRVTGWLVA